MKILFVIPNLDRAGAELLLLNICIGLKKIISPIEIRVLTVTREGTLAQTFIDAGIPVDCIPKGPHPFGRITRVLRIISYIKRYSPDIVHTHLFQADIWGLSAAKIVGIRHRISTLHNMEPRLSAKNKIVISIIGVCATQLIAVSASVRNFWQSSFWLGKKKITVIYNCPSFNPPAGSGISTKMPEAQNTEISQSALLSKPKSHTDPSHKFRLVNVARLHSQKGHAVLLQAVHFLATKFSNFSLDIYGVGEPDYTRSLELQIKNLGLEERVFLKGHSANLRSLLKDYDMMVSSSFFEGMPLAGIEGMGAALPIACTDIGPHREIMDYGEPGIFAKPGDPAALADAIYRIISEPDLYNRLSRKNLDMSGNFTLDKMLAQYKSFYTGLC